MINEIEDKNNRRNLYEALKGDFDLGTAEQFEKSMQSAEARKNLWNAIHEDYDVGTFEQFEKDMMGDKVKPEQANHSQPTNAQPNQPQPQQPQQAQFQQSLPITSKVGQTEQGNKQIAQVHNQQSSSQAMPPQATMNAPQPRQQVMSLNDRQKLWTWRNIKPTLSTGQTEQQYNARWNNEVENVKRRNDPDEIAAFNAFQKELAQQQAKVQQQGHAVVETGNQPFQSESGTEVWPISFSRKTIPHNQDYVFTLRAMQQAKGTYDLQYNIKDPEIRRDYEALTAPTDDTYRPTDAILDASPREKNKYYQWYAAYLYSNGGEMPEWLDYTAQLKLRSLNKSNLESEAKQWTNLVERTRNARKFRGSNSVSDWLNEQYNFKSGDPRIINGASYPYLVTRAGLIQTPLVQTTGRATVADNRRAYNELLQSNEQSKANPAQGDVYSTSNIINPERFWANTTKWQDLSESQKAAYKDEADYYNQMLKGQANVGYYNVGNGQNEEVEFLKHNRKQMNEQYNMLTDKERTQAVMKQAERTLNVLNGISHNLNTKLRFSIMGKGVEEDNGIRSVIRRYEKFLEVAPRYLEKRNYSAALQFWNGLTDLNGLTFGLLGVADAVSLNKIANNPPKDLIEKFGGEANAKKVIATAIQLDNMAEEYRQKLDYYGTGYSLGGLTQFGIQAGLPLFKGTEAVGKILTGGMRGLVKKATLRYMPNTAKRLGAKELVQTTLAEGTRQAMREGGIGGAAGYVAGRLGVANGVSTIVGKAAQGSVEGVVLSVPHAIANVTNNRTGQANVVEINREGIKVNDQPFTHMNQDPDGKVEADTMLREWSQWVGMRVGEVFMPFSKYVDGKVANVAKGAWNKSVGRFIDGSSFARITETFSKAANVGKAATEVGKYVSGNLKRAGMGGTLTFYAQTNLSEMLNAMTVGDVSWDDIKSDQLDKLWGAFVSNAYLVAQNNLVGTVGYYNQKSNLNKSLAQYDAQGSAAWGETDWNGIKADVDRLIDNDKNLQAYQNGVLANENLSKPQRETISQYIATRKTLQAFDLFAKVGNEKSKPNEFDIRYNDAYIAGTQVKSPDQMAQMRESLDASRNTLANLLGIRPEQVDALFADTNKSLGQIYEELTQRFVDNEKANLPNGQSVNTTNIEPIKRAIDHYCTALSMQRGVSESLITSQLEAVQKLDAKVDAATNKDSGMIERATDDMGRECYVISGNADSSNNTDMVVVRYTEDGRVASLSPKQVTIIQQTDAHELKQTNADLVDLNYEGIHNSIVNGKTLPEPNDQVVLYDGKSRGVATIEGIKYEESTKDDTRGVAAQPKSVVVKTEDGRTIELPIDTYRQWVRDGFKHDTEVYVHGTESDNSENTNEPTEGTENATEAPTLAEGLRVSINGNEYTIGKVDDSRVELIDENGKDFHWTRSALDKKLKSGDAEILASNEENTQQKPELHYGDEVELNDPDNDENIRGKVNSRDASDEVEIVTDDGRVLRYSKRELDNVIQNVYNNGEHIWSKDENKTKEASNETDTEQEPQPIGKGVFGNIYDQFKGKVKAAFDFLMKHKSGDLLGVFHRDEVGDIDLVWGNENGGLSHIITKHVGEGKDFETPEKAIEKIEEVLKDGEVIQNGQMRYVVSKDGYRVAIRKDFDGEKKNWVVTAIDYNRTKEEKGIATNPTSASHGVNGSELAAPNNSFADKVTEQSATAQAEATQNEPMPMHTVGKGKNAVLTEDWLTTTPKRGFDYIFSESGLDAEEGREFVNNKLAEAQKNLDKVKNGKPKMGTSIAAYKEAKEAYTTHVEDAQKAVDYWQSVKAEHDKVLLAERHARDEKDKALHEQAVVEEQQRMQDDARKATEQAELGSNAVAPTIRDKWNAAKKENGDADEITLPNGEVVKGHYVLTESGAASASHQATNGFAETEGFPIDENGQSVNDRDYKRDQEAQQVTRSMATDYDQRALQSPVVVSQEGVVLSGNGRTMAGELAAQDGTDTKYVDYLHSHANKFGFTPEQVNGFKHPRVVFVPNEAMPYNADTFAKFNQREQKSQNNTEMAVKMGKVVNDALFGRIMDMVSKYDTLGEFYADDNATYAVVKQLAEADIIPQTEMGHLFDGGKLSEAGQSMIEGVMIGKVFQANPDAVRQITEVKSMRQAVMTALQDIVQNNRLGGGYNLSNELAEAVNLVYRARKAGYKLGQHVSYFAHQGNLFEYDEGATVADFNNMAVMMLADVLNDGRSTQLKKVIAFYNEQATDAAQGIGDMFVGGVKSKTEIINEVNKALNNGREYNTTATSLADGQGQRNQSSKQSNDVGTSGTDGKQTNDTSAVTAEANVESGATDGEKSSAKGDVVPSVNGDTQLSEKIATASAEVNTEPTEAQKEAGNYKKGHVQVGTFDITIEQPQGSVRKGTDADGKQWESKMNNTYGYIRGAVGVDGDHIDVFLSNDIDGWNGHKVFVVDQYNPDGSFDEHKVMLGFNDADEAKSDYLANYENGWENGRRIDVTAVNLEDFEKWIASSKRKTKPFGEYSSVKNGVVPSGKGEKDNLRMQKVEDYSAIDAEYFAAVERGDLEEAQRIVNEVAKRAGYSVSSDYQGTSAFNGAAPYGNGYFLTKEERKEAWDNGDFEGESTLGDYIDNGVDGGNLETLTSNSLYRHADDMRKEAIENVRDVIENGRNTITMYRSVPSSVKEGKFRNGDWITPSRKYAEDNAELHGWGKDYRVIEQEVPVDEVWFDGNDIAEWGYGREEDYVNDTDFAYKNTKNNRKLLDVITRDDEGNIIPPSKRFNSNKADERYQKANKATQPSKEEVVLRDAVIDHLRENDMDVITDEAEGQSVLDMANGRDVRLSAKQKRALETATIADESTNNATVVSSAAGAKVQNNLEILAEGYQKRPNKTKGFITDLSRSLGLKQHESSQYGTFVTGNGKTVTIRVSNHNARVSNFDRNGENDGISIVISSHKNKGLNNDGDAHVTEFFYPKQSLERAGSKPLSEVIRSVSEALNSGVFKDTTGLAERQEVNNIIIREHRVYHGSGAEFDAFDHSHMGEGEGAQAFGWGTYVTEVEGIGRTYAESASKKPTYLYGGKEMSSDEFHDYVLGEIGDWNENMLNDFMYNLERHGVTRAKDILKKGDLAQYKKLFYQSLGDTRNYAEGKIKAARTLLSLKGIRIRKHKSHLYTIEIPDDNGKNYLDWNGHPAESLLKDVGSFLESNGFEMVQDSPARYEKGESTIVLNPNATGADLYAELQEALGSDKEASKALSEIGLTGIKYPADYIRGGREDGAKNYVIFNENDAKITDHVRFFKTKNGEAYGFTIGGKIYIDPKVATSETPVHEYAHLWASALKANNAKEWQNVVGLMKGTSVWEEVKKLYPELKSDDEIADEVLATYSGRRGAERLRKEMDDIAKSNGNVFDKATAMSALHRVKQAIEKFWHAVADFLHIHYTSAEQVADQVMKDLLDGVDPRSMMDGGKSLRPETRINIVEAKAEHGFKNYAEAKTWAKEHIARTYSSKETGGKGDIRISNAAVDKYLSQSAVDKSDSKDVHLSVLKVLPDVIRESVDAEQHADFKKGEDGVRSAENGINPNVTIHRLYGAVRMDGKVYRVKVTLKKNTRTKETPKAYSYEATKIELLEGSLSQTEGSHNLEPSNSKSEVSAGQHGNVSGLTSTFPRYSDKSITAANLLNGVEKSYGGGKFFEDYNKIREQFIGEQGAERADHAEEVSTRLDNLSVAREMENDKKDAKAIKMATGWERGADGKWRYEIPDLKYFGKGDAGYKKAREKQPWSKELDGLSDRIFDGEELSESEYQRFDELAQKEEKFKTDYLNREKPHLADWVENDELFKAYPDLKRVKMVFTDQLPVNVGGSYNEHEHTIVVNTNYVGDIASVLAHEVQHAIQQIEGFARGGNPESMQERFNAAKKEWRARAWANELRYKADEMGEHYNQAAVEKALIDEYKEMGMDNDEWIPDKETRMKGFNYFARGYADRNMDADIKNFHLNESTRSEFSPYVEYTKLGGEVESRNVEHRMNMTPEERIASLAAETEDVSREDQIFLMSGDGGNANSEMPQERETDDDYSEFAKEHGVDADMVKDYASGMKTGNLQKADIALAEIRRTMRVANRGMKLSEFGKLFRPVQKELAERYGDIEKLRQEHIDAAMRERGVMEAARKRAEEEEAKRKARSDELSLLSTEELDKRYFDAIESGDDAAAREMLDEAARRKGYDDTESNYQGVGAWIAPSNPGYESDAARREDVEDNAPDVNIEDIALGYSLVDEKYWQEPRKYMQTDATAIESVNAIREAIAAVRRGEKNVKVKVYRAVPTSVKEGKLRNGDWVTPSKDYAKMHGEHRLEGKYRIIEDEVSVNELWWDGNDSREWGFDNGKGYKYKNVKNNRKLNDLVTRDDNGEIIPPSKRFDENVEDVRYREAEPKTLKGEVALTALENIFSEPTSESLPKSISTLESFKEVFKHPIRTFLGELVKVKDEVFNKIIREKRSNISGAVLSTIENADFAIRDKDGSTIYIKRFKSDNSGNTYNIVAVNKHGEVEYYVSSVHIKRDGNLRNKIKNGAELLLPQERNTDGTLSRNNSTPTAKVENNPDTSQLSLQEKSMHQAAKAVADEMHLGGNVDVLTSTDGLTGRKKNAKGWYDPQTGRITIVLPNHNGRADVVNTMLHEAVGHYGLRELVGKEKMNEFIDFVFKNADKATRSQIAHNSAKYGWDMRKATEEYMASMAEDGTFKNVNKRWWHQLKLAFLKMLHKLGFAGFSGTTLSDNDLRYLLWRSWKNLTEGPARNIYQVAEDTWRQQHLKVGDFAEPKAVDAKTREQNLYYREERERKSARDEYERSVNTAKHKMNLAWVDSMSGLKLLQDAIVPNEKDLKDWENAYMAENRMSSTNLAEMETYKKSFYKDLLDAEQELLDKGAIHEQVTNYMMAKHGLERNEVLAFRDALKHDFANDKQKMSAAWKAYKNDATAQQNKTDFESGKISWDDYKANDTDIRERYAPSYKKYRSKDYSGLTELTTDDPSIKSYQDQIATLKEQLNNERDDATKKSIRIKIAKLNKEMVNEAERIAENSSSNFEKKYDTSELWNRTNAATKASLTKQYESGLLTDEVYHHTLDMFKNYIPLRGFDDVTSDEVYNYFGNAKGQFGGGIRSAKGRKSKADDPIATIGNMAESAIMQGNRNQMKQHFLKMVLNHPSDAVSVDQLYLHYDAATQEWKPVFAEFDEHDDANAVAQKVEAFNQRMETLCQQKPDEYKKASEAHDIQYKVVGKNINEHQVHVKMQGKDYVLTINGNPEAAQALNGQTNPDSTDNPFIKFFQSTNHFMAAMFTQKNPAFILSNLSRDSFYANSMVWAKESPAYAWKFNKNWGKSLYTLFGLITRQRKGTLNMNDKVDRMYQEFIENGGETGYTFLHSVDDYKNMIAKALKEIRRSGWNPKSWLKFLDNLINYLGTWAENTSRFAAYRTSREMGRSIEKSIWDAKEISVNFNKKGAGAKAAGKWEDGNRLNVMQAYMSQSAKELYVFWNAGVQGLSNVSRTFGKSKGKTLAVAGLYFAIGTALPMLMAALSQGSGDDDTNYYDLPDWVRRNNLCFYTGKGWVTIPLPIELRAFYGLGELAQSVLSGNEEYTATEIATKMLEQVSQLFPVDFMEGGGSLTSFVPSYAKPIVEAYVTNKDYTGTPIYKDAEYNKNRPEWTKAYKGTNQALVWASRLLNELGGGDDVKKANVGVMDVNPAKIQHLFEGYFGGLGKFVFQTMKVASMPFNEDNRELKNVPIINSFYKTSDERTKDRAITSKFYKYNDEYQKTKELLSLYKKELQAPEYKSKFYDLMYSPEGFSATMMDSYNKQLSAVRKAMSVTDPNSDKYKELQLQQVDIQKQAVKVIEATKGVVNSEDKEMKELYNLWMQDYSNDPKKAEERSNKTIEMRKDIVKRIMDIAKQNKPQKK